MKNAAKSCPAINMYATKSPNEGEEEERGKGGAWVEEQELEDV